MADVKVETKVGHAALLPYIVEVTGSGLIGSLDIALAGSEAITGTRCIGTLVRIAHLCITCQIGATRAGLSSLTPGGTNLQEIDEFQALHERFFGYHPAC